MELLACIVETRAIGEIVDCIRDHLKNLPDETDLAIMNAQWNDYVHTFFNAKIRSHVQVSNERDYNALLTSATFWEQFLQYDRVLIFQSDSVIFRPGIEEFYEWDYVGAPWKFQHHGGNGGLSLRNPKVMHKICSDFKWDQWLGNEDVFFSNILNSRPAYGKLAPREVCARFSVESIFKLGTFGGHAYSKHLSEIETNQITYQYK